MPQPEVSKSLTRSGPSLPDVPTTREAGFPMVDAVAWFGIEAPAHTPRAAIDRLATDMRAAVRDPAVQAKIEEQGAEPVGDTAEQFQSFIDREIRRWGDLVRNKNISVD